MSPGITHKFSSLKCKLLAVEETEERVLRTVVRGQFDSRSLHIDDQWTLTSLKVQCHSPSYWHSRVPSIRVIFDGDSIGLTLPKNNYTATVFIDGTC